jgi:hypothetical protein
MLVGKAKAEAYPGMENLKGFFVCVPALLTNIRPGWKGLPWTNTSLLRALVNYGRKKFCYN